MFLLKLKLQDESHLNAFCLFCILILYRKYFSFQFLYCGIRMHFSILIGVQNGPISSWKNEIFFWKMFFLKLNFQDEDQLYAHCLFHIMPLYHKCFLFQSLISCIRMHIHILTGVQTWNIISWRNGHYFAENRQAEGQLYANVFVNFWQSLIISTKVWFFSC